MKIDQTNKWYIHNRDIEIKTDPQISTRWPGLVIVIKKKKKRICRKVYFAVLADNRVKIKETEKRDKYQDIGRELKKKKTKNKKKKNQQKTIEHEAD